MKIYSKRNKYSRRKLSDVVWADEPTDLFLSQANIITGHYNLSEPNARNRWSEVLQPHSSLVPSAISTIKDATMSWIPFNLLQ